VTPADALEVLAVAAVYDEREPSVAQAQEWADVLTKNGVDTEEAFAAVRAFYEATPDGRVRVPHLLPLVKAARLKRVKARRLARLQAAEDREIESRGTRPHRFEGSEGEVCRVPGCGQTDDAGTKHIRDRSADVQALLASLRATLPEGDPRMRRSLAGWRATSAGASEDPAE